jgi:membrane-associated phospholipid phosphatase|tara:strand:- start:718 stop:1347 length:630 start_codon:yes stop_codon:yes gene_type:complete
MSARVKTKYMVLLGIFSLATYFIVQQIVTHQYDFLTSFDQAIPFLPWTVWIYHSIVPVIVMTMFLLVQTRRLFFTTFWSSFLVTVVINLFYILFPSFYPRPELSPDGITEYLVQLSYTIDNSSNTFPSGHVAFAWLMFWGSFYSQKAKEIPLLRRMFLLWAIGLSLSTLTLKMHYIIDIVGGFAVGTFCFFLVKSFIKARSLYIEDTRN